MTIKKSIKELRSRGYRITYRQRKDGGILIKSINGHKYTGAKGNKVARSLLGTKLSEARAYQLHRLNPRKGDDWTRPASRKRTPLPDALARELKVVQQLWRKGSGLVKAHTTIAGTIAKSNLRYVYETYGEQEAWQKLRKAKRYAQGYAYEENVRWFRERLTELAFKLADEFDVSGIEDIINNLEREETIENFQEEWISPIHNYYYELLKKAERRMASQIDIDSMVFQINQTIKY